MDEERRLHCLLHLLEASDCIEEAGHAVLAARLQDIVEALEQQAPDSTNPAREEAEAVNVKVLGVLH
jgi:hypothetical protein